MSNSEYRNHYKHFQKSHWASWLGPHSGSQHIFLLHAPEAAGSCPCSQEGQLALREAGQDKETSYTSYPSPGFFHLSHPFSPIMRKTVCKYTFLTQGWNKSKEIVSEHIHGLYLLIFNWISCLVTIHWAVNSEIRTETVVQNPLWEEKKNILEIPLWAQILGVEHSVGKTFHCAFAESGFGTATTAMSLILVVQYHGRNGPKTN